MDVLRTNDLLPQIRNSDLPEEKKIEMLLDYIVQMKEQIGYEIDLLKKRTEAGGDG